MTPCVLTILFTITAAVDFTHADSKMNLVSGTVFAVLAMSQLHELVKKKGDV